jgi:hypothetical protein
MSKSTRIAAAAAAALALAAPAAPARPAIDAPTRDSTPTVVAPQPSAGGFDLGSAAIGAGGVAGLVALFSAGAAAAARTRVPHTR